MASRPDGRSGGRAVVLAGALTAFLQTRDKPDVADTAWAAIERFFRAQLGR